jgi:uncharacterized BrkB/YihY/UPF0761 family membrane protein
MQLNTPQKIILGLVTIVPLIAGSVINLVGTVASYFEDGDNLASKISEWEFVHRDVNDHIAVWVLIVLLLFISFIYSGTGNSDGIRKSSGQYSSFWQAK